jgi:hypothetical protein
MGLSETMGQVMQSSILLIKTISQLSLTKGIDHCSICAHREGLEGFCYSDHICSFSCHVDNCGVWQVTMMQRRAQPALLVGGIL